MQSYSKEKHYNFKLQKNVKLGLNNLQHKSFRERLGKIFGHDLIPERRCFQAFFLSTLSSPLRSLKNNALPPEKVASDGNTETLQGQKALHKLQLIEAASQTKTDV